MTQCSHLRFSTPWRSKGRRWWWAWWRGGAERAGPAASKISWTQAHIQLSARCESCSRRRSEGVSVTAVPPVASPLSARAAVRKRKRARVKQREREVSAVFRRTVADRSRNTMARLCQCVSLSLLEARLLSWKLGKRKKTRKWHHGRIWRKHERRRSTGCWL